MCALFYAQSVYELLAQAGLTVFSVAATDGGELIIKAIETPVRLASGTSNGSTGDSL